MSEGEQAAARALEESVLAVPVVDRGAILVTGKDRTTWLNGLVTCDLVKLGPGGGAYGLIVEKKGRIQADFIAVPGRASDALVLAVPKDLRGALVETLDHYLIMEDVELAAADIAFWQLFGPKARDVIDALDVPFAGEVDLLGVGGAVVGATAENAAALEERLSSLAVERGGTVVDDATWNAVRIERGLPRFGVEFDTTMYPQEASLEKLAVSFDKGCYLGQEVVYMLENRGHVKRKLVALELDGAEVPAVGTSVASSTGVVGEIKSAVLGPRSRKPIALAMIKWAESKPGTELRVGELPARVRS